jgi:hypothetical protein
MVAAAEAELTEDMARFAHDPLGHVIYSYPWGKPGTDLEHEEVRKWQRKLLTRIGDQLKAGRNLGVVIREAIASGHGIGKSAFVAWIILWALSCYGDARATVTANTEGQLLTKTMPELQKWHRLSVNSHWFSATATALSSNQRGHEKTWRADVTPWSESRPESWQGLHNKGKLVLLIFDEASAIPDTIWDSADGAMTDEGTTILWLVFGNMTRASGRFRECFRKQRHLWGNEHVDSRDVEGTNKTEIQKWVDTYGEDSDFVKIRVRGLPPAQSDLQLIGEDVIDAAYGRHVREDQYNFAAKIIACDPAWTGADKLVIGLRQGLLFQVKAVMPFNDNDGEVANYIARLEDEEQADAVFVDGGFGTGIVSFGKSLKRDWKIVWFGSKSSNPLYRNKRTEMWGEMKQWLKDGGAIPKLPELRDDLAAPQTWIDKNGCIELESKEEMKARGQQSPNHADCLAITFAFPVLPRTRSEANALRRQQFAVTDYDPMDFDRAGALQRAVTDYDPMRGA